MSELKPDPWPPEGREELNRKFAEEDARRAAAIEALPCRTTSKAGDAAGARAACGDAHRTCPELFDFRDQDLLCVHVADHRRYFVVSQRLEEAPRRVRERVARAERGRWKKDEDRRDRLAEINALDDRNSLRVARAWTSRKAVSVELLGGGTVDFRGDEEVLVIAAGTGVGKSTAAGWALAHCGENGARWISARIFADLPTRDEENGDAFEASLVAPFLIVDDLGVEYIGPSGWATARAQQLFEARHERQLRTFITCNLSRPEFAARYGLRCDDRLRESGIYVTLGDSSLRGVR